MEDHQIIELYWNREESAIRETEAKYGRYLHQIASRILSDGQDVQEVVNDTYLGAWNSIPPQRPTLLSAYLSKITRRIAIDVYRKRTSVKRRGDQYAQSLEELSQCVTTERPSVSEKRILETPEDIWITKELSATINDWLWQQQEEMRHVFLWRYFYMESILDIASRKQYSESKVKSMLHRMRKSLRAYLEKEGYYL